MGTGYTRNDTANNIADGNVINASDLDGEFDALQSAFNGTTGHSHDGTSGEGPPIDTDGIANDAVTLGTKTSGNYVAAGAVSGVGLSGSASAEGATFTVTSNATNANTASTIVSRDASGNFSAGTVTAALSGNASTATALATARDIAGQSFDGTANITIASTDLSDSGSIDAATLDSIDSTSFLRSDAADTKTSGDLSFSDNVKAVFGAGSDLQLYHDGTHSYVQDAGTGDLRISGNNVNIMNGAATENYIVCTNNGSVAVKYDNATKVETTTSGIDVTGDVLSDTFTLDNGASDWQFSVVSNNLIISYAGTAKMKLDTSGNLTVTGDVISEGTI
jgi:hypothetical protein